MKRAYKAPTVTSLGKVEDLTQSRSWIRIFDTRGLFGQKSEPPGLS